MRAPILIPLLLLLFACAASDLEALDDEPHDTVTSAVTAIDHGPLRFGDTAVQELTAAAGSHAWEFDLHGEAEVTVQTSPPAMDPAEVDTAVALYRERPTGWGSSVGSNDNAGGTRWSRLRKKLTAGHYRVLVKGHTASVRGRFALQVSCDGAGCLPPAPPIDTSACLFGHRFDDLSAPRPDLQVIATETLRAGRPITAYTQAQIAVAVQQAPYVHPTTAAEAFALVDEGSIRGTILWYAKGRQSYFAYDFHVGGVSHGAVFAGVSSEPAALVHGGALYNCSAVASTCLLGDEYQDLVENPDYSLVQARTVTSSRDVSGANASAALEAVLRIHPEVSDLDAAIRAADDDRLNLRWLHHVPTGMDFLSVEFGAGDTSVGSVYHWTGLTWRSIAVIEDGGFDDCGFTRP